MSNQRKLMQTQDQFLGTQRAFSGSPQAATYNNRFVPQNPAREADATRPLMTKIFSCSNAFNQLLKVSQTPGLTSLPLSTLVSPKNLAIIKSKQSLANLSALQSSLEVHGEKKQMDTLAEWEEQQRRKHEEANRTRRQTTLAVEGALAEFDARSATDHDLMLPHPSPEEADRHQTLEESDAQEKARKHVRSTHKLIKVLHDSSRRSLKSKAFGQRGSSGPIIWSKSKDGGGWQSSGERHANSSSGSKSASRLAAKNRASDQRTSGRGGNDLNESGVISPIQGIRVMNPASALAT